MPRRPPEAPCDVCGAIDALERWLEVSVVQVFDRWIYRCRSCGFHQVRPRLTTNEILQLYPSDYFDAESPVGYHDYARESQRRRREAFFLARRCDPGRVLEVGCALGFLLVALRHEGFEVAGVDASAFASYYGQTRFEIPIAHGVLEDARFDDNTFDLVIQKDLLEHVSEPRAHLSETWRVMKPGGRLWLITPNGQANLRPLAAVASSGPSHELPLLDQGHLSFFTESNLRRLFGDCGFEVERALVIGVRRGLRALGWLPGQRRFAGRADRVDSAAKKIGVEAAAQSRAVFETLAKAVDHATERHRRWVHRQIPYFYIHRFSKALDTLPASTGLGYDFEFWLRKRARTRTRI